MNCINCNKEIPNGITICPNCGSKTNSSSIIMPTESEPRTMPSGGLNNNNVPLFGSNKTDNNNNVNEEKKDKKSPIVFVGIGLIVLAFILCVVFGIIIPNSNTDEPTNTNTNAGEVVLETMIGEDEYGYLSLPGDWDSFETEDDFAALQYSKGDWIIYMDSADIEYDTITAETVAKTFLTDEEEDVENVDAGKMIETTVADYAAYQVSLHFLETDKWLLGFYFEPGDGKIHYIGIEGPDEKTELFEVLDTFSLTEIE